MQLLTRISLALLLTISPVHSFACSLKIGIADHSSDVSEVYLNFLQQVYKELGCELVLVKQPGRRAMVEANAGRLDGLLLLPEIIQTQYNNLLLVRPSLTQVDIAAYTHDATIDLSTNPQLAGVSVGIIRGYELTQRSLPQADIEVVNDYAALFSMLEKQRITVGVALRREARRFLAANPNYAGFTEHAQPVIETPLFHYLSKARADLHPKVEDLLASQLKSGRLQALLNQYETKQ